MKKTEERRDRLKKMAVYIDSKKKHVSGANAEGLQFLDDLLKIVFELNDDHENTQQHVGMSDSFVDINGPHKIR